MNLILFYITSLIILSNLYQPTKSFPIHYNFVNQNDQLVNPNPFLASNQQKIKPLGARMTKSSKTDTQNSVKTEQLQNKQSDSQASSLRPLSLRTMSMKNPSTYDQSSYIKMLSSAQSPYLSMNMNPQVYANLNLQNLQAQQQQQQQQQQQLAEMAQLAQMAQMAQLNQMNQYGSMSQLGSFGSYNPMSSLNQMNSMMIPQMGMSKSRPEYFQSQSYNNRRTNNTLRDERLKLLEDEDFLKSNRKLGQFLYAKNRDAIMTNQMNGVSPKKQKKVETESVFPGLKRTFGPKYMQSTDAFAKQKATKANKFKFQENKLDEDYEEETSEEIDKTLKGTNKLKFLIEKDDQITTETSNLETKKTTTTTTSKSETTQLPVFKQSEEAKNELRIKDLAVDNLPKQTERIESEPKEEKITNLSSKKKNGLSFYKELIDEVLEEEPELAIENDIDNRDLIDELDFDQDNEELTQSKKKYLDRFRLNERMNNRRIMNEYEFDLQ